MCRPVRVQSTGGAVVISWSTIAYGAALSLLAGVTAFLVDVYLY